MRILILGIAFIVQSLVKEAHCDVNNVVKSKIIFSNQDLSEKNSETIRRTNKPILSRKEIFEQLKQHVVPSDIPRLVFLLNMMNERELQHIDFLMHMMSYYGPASQSLLQSIIDILEEDETEFKTLMSNFNIR